jgi:hydroxyethylthiazole kinase-like sugar kinase family protein
MCRRAVPVGCSCTALVAEALGARERERRLLAIQCQTGLLFRTAAFNAAARAQTPPRHIDTLTLSQLHALKADATNRTVNSKVDCHFCGEGRGGGEVFWELGDNCQ